MGDQAHVFVVYLAKVIEFSGVAIIVGGIILAAVNFIRDGLRLRDWVLAYRFLCRSGADLPTIEDGFAGVAMIDAVLRSSAAGGAWTPIES